MRITWGQWLRTPGIEKKQMFVALGKEFDMIQRKLLSLSLSTQIVRYFVVRLRSTVKSDDETKQKCLAPNLFSLSCLISVSKLIWDTIVSHKVCLLSKILFQIASLQIKKVVKGCEDWCYSSFHEHGNSRPSDSEVCRTITTQELIHGLTHHKVLNGSVLLVKQMQKIVAFGFC